MFYFPLKSSNKFTFLVTSERNSWYVSVPKLLHLSFNLWILKSERYWDSIFSFFPYKKNIEEANPLYESMEKEPTNYKPVWGKHESENLERPYFSINSTIVTCLQLSNWLWQIHPLSNKEHLYWKSYLRKIYNNIIKTVWGSYLQNWS